jgi:phosphoribosylaminoimidazolecarboxamide formyltransferase/IMP cyclohydrolase
MEQYADVEQMLEAGGCNVTLEDRRKFAAAAFDISSHYDTAIFKYMNAGELINSLKVSERKAKILRYGENPHQKGIYYGQLEEIFEQLNGKELSYNNLVDIDSAVGLMEEFKEDTAFAIMKHTNACGCATGKTVKEAYLKAFEADTISPFGGVLITNQTVDGDAAQAMHKLFFEILIAPAFSDEALGILKQKKNRILLHQKSGLQTKKQFKSILNGVIEQERDLKTDSLEDLEVVTKKPATNDENRALLFASKICKHTKSNTIVLAREGQMIASGVGQTSRVDALQQAIAKAKHFGLSLEGAVMASDAFFPFSDSVEIANKAGVKAVIQPGGSIRDKDSIEYCDKNNMVMVFTGTRHFKH